MMELLRGLGRGRSGRSKALYGPLVGGLLIAGWSMAAQFSAITGADSSSPVSEGLRRLDRQTPIQPAPAAALPDASSLPPSRVRTAGIERLPDPVNHLLDPSSPSDRNSGPPAVDPAIVETYLSSTQDDWASGEERGLTGAAVQIAEPPGVYRRLGDEAPLDRSQQRPRNFRPFAALSDTSDSPVTPGVSVSLADTVAPTIEPLPEVNKPTRLPDDRSRQEPIELERIPPVPDTTPRANRLADPNRFKREPEIERLPETTPPVRSLDRRPAESSWNVDQGGSDISGQVIPVQFSLSDAPDDGERPPSAPGRFLSLPPIQIHDDEGKPGVVQTVIPIVDPVRRSVSDTPWPYDAVQDVAQDAALEDPSPSDQAGSQEPEQETVVDLPPLAPRPLDALPYKETADRTQERPTDVAAARFGAYEDGSMLDEVIRSRQEGDMEILWSESLAMWEAPSFFHRPLYFEQVNLERYGHYRPLFQPVLAGAHFFGTIPILPYKMGVHHPCEPIYVLGHYRPGNCNPHQIHRLPFSWRGVAYQGIATTGLIFSLPTVP